MCIKNIKNILFIESELIEKLSNPTGNILKIGCNFGEKKNINYKEPKPIIKSNKGRKPKKRKY